jgi:hypothetical protein
MKSIVRNRFLRSLAIRERVRTFLVRMQFGSVEPGSPFWERMAASAH